MTYDLSVKATGDIVTLAEVKAFLRVTGSSEDALIQMLIKSAVASAETAMNRDLLTATWINYRDAFFQDLTLRRGGFQSVESIEYLKDGSYTTLSTDDYTASIAGTFGVICEIDVPSSDRDCNDVKITFKAGFGDTEASIPADIKIAIMMDVSFMYSNRGDCAPGGGGAGCGCDSKSMAIYKNYRIINTAIDEPTNDYLY